MRKLRLRFSIFSFIFLLFFSCKSFKLQDVKSSNSDKSVFENLYFTSNEDYIYKCGIDIYTHHLSGILIIKKTAKNTHRIVMTTDFSNKLIDFEITDNQFKINYIVPDMDKKIVKNFLKKDFSILMKKDFPVSETFTNENQQIYLSRQGKQSFYCFVNNKNLLLEKMIFTENDYQKINFIYQTKTPIFADEIIIKHVDYKINITLQKLENN